MTTGDLGSTSLLRHLLDGTGGWWSSARVRVVRGDGLVPAGAARLLLRRPLMGVPAGVRVEDAGGEVLARALGPALDGREGLRALLDPLALATGLPPAVGALPPRRRREAVGALELVAAQEGEVDGVPAVSGLVRGLARGLGDVSGADRADAAPGVTSVVLDRASGLPLEVGPSGGLPLLALRVDELDPRPEDDAFTGGGRTG